MSNNKVCPIWETRASCDPKTGDYERVNSPRADGRYWISRRAIKCLENCDERTKARLTTWLIEQRRLGDECPKIYPETISSAKQSQDLPAWERADRLLNCIEQRTPSIGQPWHFSLNENNQILARTECTKNDELRFLTGFLETNGWLEKGIVANQAIQYTLTVDGYSRLSDLEHKVVVTARAFVAMWFDGSTKAAWEEGIKPAVEDAGYEAIRIDQKEHVNKIDDEIIAEIRRARFIVADFTHGDNGPRGGVYYEAGFAHGLDIPVIFTCRKDALEKVHFDTRQYNHIVWETPDELRSQLTNRIAAVIGDGPGST